MIFLTVGVQLPFDRLVRTVDSWAEREDRDDILAQIGRAKYVPRRLRAQAMMSEVEFRRSVESADVVVAHAGMGSIITALELGKRIIVMPRRAELGEHRNDHQLATARFMAAQKIVSVAADEPALLKQLKGLGPSVGKDHIAPYASEGLIKAIQEQISRGPVRSGWGRWSRRS